MADQVQRAKQVVLQYLNDLSSTDSLNVRAVLQRHTSSDYVWRGMHPFNEKSGAEQVAKEFWSPLLQSFAHMQRRNDVFIAGLNNAKEDGSIWVMSMGHMLGLFDHAWLAIPPTRKIVMLRFAEFHRVSEGKIAETGLFFDILHLMQQAGFNPIPVQTGINLVQPGPASHDGLLYTSIPDSEGAETCALIRRMCSDISYSNDLSNRRKELAAHWKEDMLWWGPAGIGATYTIDRYIEQHASPFRAHLRDREFHGHLAFVTEGNYGGFFGWPNLSMQNVGGFMGLPAFEGRSEMRVVDVYRREGDKLAENWIFIDMLHFLIGQGIDVLEQVGALTNGGAISRKPRDWR